MNQLLLWGSTLAAAVWLVGCSSTQERPEDRVDAEIAAAEQQQGVVVASGVVTDERRASGAIIHESESAGASGAVITSPFVGRPIAEILNDPDSGVAQQVFYFEYDSSSLDEASRTKLLQHAQLMRERLELTVVLEGHADERGSREYNLALGERRAQAVARIFALEGIAQSGFVASASARSDQSP